MLSSGISNRDLVQAPLQIGSSLNPHQDMLKLIPRAHLPSFLVKMDDKQRNRESPKSHRVNTHIEIPAHVATIKSTRGEAS